MGALLKETLAKLGGRGGGSKDLAQGGVPSAEGLRGRARSGRSKTDRSARNLTSEI